MDFYYNPDKYGMSQIGEIDWSDGNYQFDLTVVWRKEDGSFVYGEDSGCSCPTPFENMDAQDLIKIESLQNFQDYLVNHSTRDGDRQMDIVNLIEKLHGLGLR